jgi:hypothetical protein
VYPAPGTIALSGAGYTRVDRPLRRQRTLGFLHDVPLTLFVGVAALAPASTTVFRPLPLR